MRVVIQRVSEASVTIDGSIHGAIKKGLLILLGITHEDMQEDINWLVNKISGMRIFSDMDGKMNLSIQDIDGEILLVSQFTLFANTKKRQPSQLYRGCKTRGGGAFIPCFCQHAFAKAKQRNSYRNIWSRYESTISQ